MKLEGFERKDINLRYDLMARYGGQLWETKCTSPVSRIRSIEDLREVIKAFEEEYLGLYAKEAMVPVGGVEIVTFALVSSVRAAKPVFKKHKYVGKKPSPDAGKGEREVYGGVNGKA
jgi:N-methylhydantoinase A/oxoprolinase/acetone carboxylase beta subunit